MSIKEDFQALDATKMEQARMLEQEEKAKLEESNAQQGSVIARIKSLLGGDDTIDLSLFSDDEIELLEKIDDISELMLDDTGHLIQAPKNPSAEEGTGQNAISQELREEQNKQLSAIRQALARTRAAQKKVVHPKDDTMEIIRLEKQAATEARAYLAVKQIPPMNTCAIVGNDGFGANRSVWSLCESGNDFEELICQIGYTLLGRYSTGGFISKLTVFAPTMAAYVLARYVWAGLPDYEAETDPVKKAFAAMAAQAKFSGLDVDVIPTECPTEHGQMMADLMARECMANLTSYHIVSEAEQAERIVASVTAQNKTNDKEEKQ